MNERGFEIHRDVIPRRPIDRALRLIHAEVRDRGLGAGSIGAWHRNKCWFPHLRERVAIRALLERARWTFMGEGSLVPCEPQIILHFPDEAKEWPLEPHVDEEPPWAGGRPYHAIVGVPLSPWREENGGLVVWPFDTGEPEPVELDPGDAVVMHPKLGHSGCLNRTGAIRYALYFRFLEAMEKAA